MSFFSDIFGGGDPPPPPDYVGAAQATSAGSAQAAIINALMNRANQSNPYGSQTWTQNGTTSVPGIGGQPGFDVPNFSSSTTFTPQGKQLFDKDTAIKLGLMDTAGHSLQQAQNSLSTPFSLSGLPADYNQKVADAMYKRATASLDPQWTQGEDKERSRLINSGFSQGTEGYDNAIGNFQRSKDAAYGDARDRSIISGTQYGLQDRQQGINELLLQRTQPLTELNSIRTGAQPNAPTFGSTNVGANAQGPDLLHATTAEGQYNADIYNSKTGSSNALMGALGMLGGGAAAGYFGSAAGSAALAMF